LKEARTHSVGRMGGDTDPDPACRQWAELVDSSTESGEALLCLIWMGAEDFLIGHAGPLGLGKNGEHCTGISGVRDGSNSRGITLGQTPARRLHILRWCTSRLQLPQLPDPGSKVGLLDPAFEAGQLEVGMRVDEARKDGGIFEVGGGNSMRVRYRSVGAHCLKPPIRPDQDCSALDGVAFDRNQPAGGQAPRPHFSAADSGSVRSPP
jgi:hypothetical protein